MDLTVHPYEGQLGAVLDVQMEKNHGVHLAAHLPTVTSAEESDVVAVVFSEAHVEQDRKMDLAVHAYQGQLGVVLEVQLKKNHGVHLAAHLPTVTSAEESAVVAVVFPEAHVEQDRKMDLAVHAYQGQLGVVVEVQLKKDHGMHLVLHVIRVESFLVEMVVTVVLEAHVEQDRKMDLADHAYECQVRVVLEVQLEMDHRMHLVLHVTRVESFVVVVAVVLEAHVEQD